MPFRVAIIGAGLAGSLLGNGLLSNNIDFTIYESDARNADARREGYQIRLGAPALVGFKKCLTELQLAALYPMFGRSGGMVASAPILYDTSMRTLLDLTKFPAYIKSAPISRVILRDFLRKALDLNGKIEWGKKFAGYDVVRDAHGDSSGVALKFSDGTSVEYDILISAEGSRSIVNQQVGLRNIVILEKKWAFLAKANLTPSKLLMLTLEVQKAPLVVIKDGYILYCSAYLPDGYNHEDTDIIGDMPPSDEDTASIFWSLSVPTDRIPEGKAQKISDKLQFCLDQTAAWDPKLHEILKAVGPESVHVLQLSSSTQPAMNWRQKLKDAGDPRLGNDRIWLMGDAIHPMPPSRGMGANQAMRDAADALPLILQLAQTSREGHLTDHDYALAVAQYENEMIPRAFKWVRSSGGTNENVIEPTSFWGRIMLFFAARALDLAYAISLIRWMLGYKINDEASELLG